MQTSSLIFGGGRRLSYHRAWAPLRSAASRWAFETGGIQARGLCQQLNLPELMPVDVGKLTVHKIDKLVHRCGLPPVWKAYEQKMESGEVQAEVCKAMLRHSTTAEQAVVLASHLQRLGALDLEAGNLLLESLGRHAVPPEPHSLKTGEERGDPSKDTERVDGWTEMMKVFRGMVREGIRPDCRSFAAMIKYRCRMMTKSPTKRNRATREKWIQLMLTAMGPRLDAHGYILLAKIALAEKKHNVVEAVYRTMLDRGVPTEVTALEVMIQSRLESGRLGDGLRLHRRVRAINNGLITERILVQTIKAYLKADLYSDAVLAYHRAKVNGPEPPEAVYRLLMPAVRQKGSPFLWEELNASYRWNILKEGVIDEEIRQKKLKDRLIRSLKYAGPKSLLPVKRIRMPEPKQTTAHEEEGNNDVGQRSAATM